MKTHILPFSPVPVSALCLGTARFGVQTSVDDAFRLMDRFAEMGGTLLDTARVYGDFDQGIQGISEAVIGRWLRARGMQDRMIVATKGAHRAMDAARTPRLDAASLRGDLQASRDALGLDTIPLYFLHRDDETRPVAEIMDTLHAFVAAGFVRAIGTSNWRPARIAAANAYARQRGITPFTVNEPQWSLARVAGFYDDTLRTLDADAFALHCREQMPCMPFSSQAQGYFQKLLAGGDAALDKSTRDQYDCPANRALADELRATAAETGHSPATLALAYLTSQPFPVCPVVGVRDMAQLDALADAADCTLPEHIVARWNTLRGLTTARG